MALFGKKQNKQDAQKRAAYTVVQSMGKMPNMAVFTKQAEGGLDWFGGNFLLKRGQSWPMLDGVPLTPLLQLDVQNQDVATQKRFDFAKLVQVYIKDPTYLPSDLQPSGQNWLIKVYSGLDDMELAVQPAIQSVPQKAIKLNWQIAQTPDYPDYDEMIALMYRTDRQAHSILQNNYYDDYYTLFTCNEGTKVGGYGAYVGRPPFIDEKNTDYILQIQPFIDIGYSMGNMGNLYVARRKDGTYVAAFDEEG